MPKEDKRNSSSEPPGKEKEQKEFAKSEVKQNNFGKFGANIAGHVDNLLQGDKIKFRDIKVEYHQHHYGATLTDDVRDKQK